MKITNYESNERQGDWIQFPHSQTLNKRVKQATEISILSSQTLFAFAHGFECKRKEGMLKISFEFAIQRIS